MDSFKQAFVSLGTRGLVGALVLLCLLGLSACGGSSQQAATDSTTLTAGTAQLLTWDSITLKRSYYDDQAKQQGSSVEVTITYRYPVGDSLLTKLFGRLTFGDGFDQYTPQQALERYLQEVQQEYLFGRSDGAELYTAQELSEMRSSHTLETKAAYEDVARGVLTLQKDLHTYSAGAAHGLFGSSYYNIDLQEHSVLSEGDLFVDGYTPALAKVLQRCALRQFACKTPSELERKEGIYVTDIAPNDNFAFTPEGLRYCFNPYEVAPYAIGQVHILVPYAELQELVRPGSVLASFLPQ